jgi:hypothetical protein
VKMATASMNWRLVSQWCWACRGLSMLLDDAAMLAAAGPLFDGGLYEYFRRALLLGREPS